MEGALDLSSKNFSQDFKDQTTIDAEMDLDTIKNEQLSPISNSGSEQDSEENGSHILNDNVIKNENDSKSPALDNKWSRGKLPPSFPGLNNIAESMKNAQAFLNPGKNGTPPSMLPFNNKMFPMDPTAMFPLGMMNPLAFGAPGMFPFGMPNAGAFPGFPAGMGMGFNPAMGGQFIAPPATTGQSSKKRKREMQSPLSLSRINTVSTTTVNDTSRTENISPSASPSLDNSHSTPSINSDQEASADPGLERKRKNNEAAKRSRETRRMKEEEIAIRAALLEQENLKLRAQVAILKNETTQLHCMLYQL